MRVFKKQTIWDPYWELCDDPGNAGGREPHQCDYSFSNASVQQCEINGNGFVSFRDPVDRMTIRDFEFSRTKMYASFVGVHFSNVIFDQIQTGRHPLMFRACFFDRVVFKGKCGQIMLDWAWSLIAPGEKIDKRTQDYDEDNTTRHQNSSWAMDISEIEASGFDRLECVPGDKIITNEVDQIRIARSEVYDGKWRERKFLERTTLEIVLDDLAKEMRFETVVIAAPKRSKYYQQELSAMIALLDSGIGKMAANKPNQPQ